MKEDELDLIIDLLPDDYRNYFTTIMWTFDSLQLGSKLGLFHYKVTKYGGKVENEKNYPRNVKLLIEKFQDVSPALNNRRNPPPFPKSKEELELRGGVNFEDMEIWKEGKLQECENTAEKQKILNAKPTAKQLRERVAKGIWLHIPKAPKELKADLELALSKHTNDDNIRIVIEALFGAKKLPKKTDLQKFSKLLAQKITKYSKNDEPFKWIDESKPKN